MSAAPRIGVLALQGDVREHVLALESAGAFAVRVTDEPMLGTVDGLVIPGGESTTMSKLALRDGLMEPLRERRQDGLPMYGSCAGMIMLADRVLDARPDQETIGGLDITVRRNAFGRQVDSFEIDLPMPAIGPADFRAVFIRAPWVEAVGTQVEVLGALATGSAAGTIVAVRQGNLLATSFHPELAGDGRIHDYFVRIVRRLA
ncbi:MAG: pyridoxal 5'-phosphate synthase glutaminase subunit PdxT [Actinomycetales bacterium]|nr:pyridoxal 5'-phosphate synthase glutaminase subunit PdxT [Actinomycetales bacterium]